MNRFKFRAFLKKENKMVEVDEIDFSGQWITYKGQTEQKVYRFKDIILMQSIGTTDCNGKDIYEGDIIDIHQTVNGQNLFIITYSNLKVTPIYLWGDPYEYDVLELLDYYKHADEVEIEVIGNIYQNKEIDGVITLVDYFN